MAGLMPCCWRDSQRVMALSADLLPKTFMLPGWAYAFREVAGPVGMWAYWCGRKMTNLTLQEAAADLMRVRGCTRQRAYQMLKEGNRVTWIIRDGHVRMNRPRYMAGWAIGRGAPKKSWISTPLYALRVKNIQVLRAFSSMAVMMAAGDGTPRAYTAKAISARVGTVSAYRDILRRERMITTQKRYREDPEGFAAHGKFWHRISDLVLPGRRCQIIRTQKPLKGIPSGQRAGMGKVLQNSKNLKHWIESGSRLERFGPAIIACLGQRVWRKLSRAVQGNEDWAKRQLLTALTSQIIRLQKYANNPL